MAQGTLERVLGTLEREVPLRVWIAVAGLLAAWTLLQLLLARWRAASARWGLERQAARAADAESWAYHRLRAEGYAITGIQVRTSYRLMIDERAVTVGLRADYLVRRKGETFVAEVKSGRFAPSVETAATRRQLLEYRIAFGVDGVLLVDAETGLVQRVTFPRDAIARLASSS